MTETIAIQTPGFNPKKGNPGCPSSIKSRKALFGSLAVLEVL
jgi:hypothetical protein